MKTITLLKSLVVSILIGTGIFGANAFAEVLTKKEHKEFTITNDSKLIIDNRFGLISIENWDQNSISIDVEITVEHSSRDRAERMLSAIQVTLEQQGNDIRGITLIDEKLMKSFNNFNFGSSTKELKIDYRIKMPSHVDVELKNKFGDIFIDQLTGHSNIILKYGNLKANRIMYGSDDPLSRITLGYGNASIDELDWMRFDVKYGNLEIVKAKAIVIMSKYTNVSVNELSSLVVESKYDTYKIGKAHNIVGTSGYTNYKLGWLGKQLDIESKYGDVRIESVANNFNSISFVGSYCSIYAPIPAEVSYNINGEVSYGGISYNDPSRVSRIDSNNKISVNGTVGLDEGANGQVKIRVKYGSANLK
ncbi:MAG: hypothetical protein PHD06_03650 [Bacteroidales bacterium]|nr:hypothetical protein [Bacteroidales bacterium]MDD4384255.1 hypothetical protein [Bacteroidales bacterium]MDY0197415.1 hypothetical protein [Tenuifilaceae bacterium]